MFSTLLRKWRNSTASESTSSAEIVSAYAVRYTTVSTRGARGKRSTRAVIALGGQTGTAFADFPLRSSRSPATSAQTWRVLTQIVSRLPGHSADAGTSRNVEAWCTELASRRLTDQVQRPFPTLVDGVVQAADSLRSGKVGAEVDWTAILSQASTRLVTSDMAGESGLLRFLGRDNADTWLLQAQALSRGLSTSRFSPTDFHLADASGATIQFAGGDLPLPQAETRVLAPADLRDLPSTLRLLVVGGEVQSAVALEPASVSGDGVRPIYELVLRKNAARRLNPALRRHPLVVGTLGTELLEGQGLTLTNVPPAGVRIKLGTSPEIQDGADSIAALSHVSPNVKAIAEAASEVPVYQVDFAWDGSEYHPILVSPPPSLAFFQYPSVGVGPNVARAVFAQVAKAHDFSEGATHEPVTVGVSVEGVVQQVGYRAWMRRMAIRAGVGGWVRNLPTGGVEAELCGSAQQVALLALASITGPRRAQPTLVLTRAKPTQSCEEFRIIR